MVFGLTWSEAGHFEDFKVKLDNLFLDEDRLATNYVNGFLKIKNTLEFFQVVMSDVDLLDAFINHIKDETYDWIKNDFTQNNIADFKTAVQIA